MIKIEDVEYKYKTGDHALHNINLTINKGEFVAIVGQNGSGKSTLARLIAGIENPTSGKILVNGIYTTDKQKNIDLRKTIGIVFQNPENQIIFEKIEDDIAFGLKNIGIEEKEIKERIKEATKKVKIENLSDAFEISLGQKQRVAIASVLAMQPKCIIFDEPTAMLDPKGKIDIHNIIVELNKNGYTVIYVTNVIDEVLSADRIVILNKGNIEFEIKKQEIFNNIERLKNLGLEIPIIVDIITKLKEKGINIEPNTYTTDELIKEITKKHKENI